MKKAFTLAEVLITLGIIGIVAAMIIPTLQNNSAKTQYITGVKKAYTVFNQALIQMSSDMGCVGDLRCTGLFNSNYANATAANQAFGTEMVKYIKTIKNCETSITQSTYGCFADETKDDFNEDSNSSASYDFLSIYRFISADGMSFALQANLGNCPSDFSGVGHLVQTCGSVIIDVNGLKKPNRFGRDTFIFIVTNAKGPLLYPYGGSDFSPNWRTLCLPNTGYADSCAGRIVEEGWQMTY